MLFLLLEPIVSTIIISIVVIISISIVVVVVPSERSGLTNDTSIDNNELAHLWSEMITILAISLERLNPQTQLQLQPQLVLQVLLPLKLARATLVELATALQLEASRK